MQLPRALATEGIGFGVLAVALLGFFAEEAAAPAEEVVSEATVTIAVETPIASVSLSGWPASPATLTPDGDETSFGLSVVPGASVALPEWEGYVEPAFAVETGIVATFAPEAPVVAVVLDVDAV